MKIPTLLGLAMLVTALALGGIIYSYSNQTAAQTLKFIEPKDIQVVNIQDTQVTVIWQTDNPSPGQIVYGEKAPTQTVSDNRDKQSLIPHLVHFVTIPNLKPETKYLYLIKSDKFFFPETPMEFQTAKSLSDDSPEEITKPLRGTILNTNLNPIDESLIFLKLSDGQDLVTFSSTAGNFVLPLKDLRTKDLSSYYNFSEKEAAKLIVKKGTLSSEVDLFIPEAQAFPPLTIGQNINLKDYTPQPKTKIVFSDDSSIPNKFDLNSDGKTNSLDLAILRDKINQKTTDLKYDFTQDNSVNQKDIDLLQKALQ